VSVSLNLAANPQRPQHAPLLHSRPLSPFSSLSQSTRAAAKSSQAQPRLRSLPLGGVPHLSQPGVLGCKAVPFLFPCYSSLLSSTAVDHQFDLANTSILLAAYSECFPSRLTLSPNRVPTRPDWLATNPSSPVSTIESPGLCLHSTTITRICASRIRQHLTKSSTASYLIESLPVCSADARVTTHLKWL
jgi:hypothetical protein